MSTRTFYRLRLFFLVILICAVAIFKGTAQNINPVSIDGLSTGSIYDLMADSKGFIWVAHETGISRYDGNHFTHFNSEQQTSLAMTGIIEDRQGKIWCHNFNGQLFYIDREKMTLLKAYDNSQEKSYQRTVLLGDEILSTSDKGIFFCNTATLKCRVESVDAELGFTRTIAVAGGNAIALGQNWYAYKKGIGLRKLKIDPSFNNVMYALQPLVTDDTIYAIENPYRKKFYVYKFVVRKDSLIIAGYNGYNTKLNTVTKDANQILINTSTRTEYNDGSLVAEGFDLTSRATDHQGNRWYSSLQKGLLYERRTGMWEKVNFPEITQDDYIKSLASTSTYIICGTVKGFIFFKNVKTGKIDFIRKVPQEVGSVLNMFRYCANGLIVTPSVGVFLYDTRTGASRVIQDHGVIKKVAATDKMFLLATSDSLVYFPLTKNIKTLFDENAIIDINQVGDDCEKMVKLETCLRQKRCKYVCYDKSTNTVYASFLDGLFGWRNGSFDLMQYGNEPAHAFSFAETGSKIILSSFKGLLYLDKNEVKPLSKINLLKSDMVTSLKVYKDYLFLIEKDAIQVFDIHTEELLSTIPLPDKYSGLVYNIEMIDDKLYLANTLGLYTLDFSSFKKSKEALPVNYLLNVTANNKDITFGNTVLETSENNLTFTFSAPGYVFPSHTFFYYQLKGSNDTSWHKMKDAEFVLSFASLKPGNYTLNAYAVDYKMRPAKKPISFRFIIKRPWWQNVWVISGALVALAFGIYYSVLYRFKVLRKRTQEKELRQQQFETELLQSQIAVQEQERKRIAEDLHDDIGATLSALHLHISNIPEQTLQKSSELQWFYKQSLLLASKAASDVRSISHDLLPKDFSDLGLFAVLQNRIEELNGTDAIQFTFITDGDEKLLDNIYSITIYRIVNELISNIIKHSQAQQAMIQILINVWEIQIMAEDNGIGIHTLNSKRGIGMKNIQSRIDFLKGRMHIDSSEKGTAIIITVPIDRDSVG